MDVKKYIKKPTVVEAIQWDGTWEDAAKIKAFSMDVFERHDLDHKRSYLWIHTSEGPQQLKPGQFIVKDKDGLHNCYPEQFKETHDEVVPLKPLPIDPELRKQLPEEEE